MCTIRNAFFQKLDVSSQGKEDQKKLTKYKKRRMARRASR
jgi:hypothetical protein